MTQPARHPGARLAAKHGVAGAGCSCLLCPHAFKTVSVCGLRPHAPPTRLLSFHLFPRWQVHGLWFLRLTLLYCHCDKKGHDAHGVKGAYHHEIVLCFECFGYPVLREREEGWGRGNKNTVTVVVKGIKTKQNKIIHPKPRVRAWPEIV